ncbi:MAG TPA: Xaa-Pro aminopeptidase [Gemmatimonadaceae bacterium]|nr:Xaa-Pro aminopeptidase [Gemmatimonadaceae bacterium]
MNRLLRPLLVASVLALPIKLGAQFTSREYAARRDALLARLPDAIVLALGAPEPREDYLEFYQRPDMLYLTGVKEPDVALVMVKHNGRVSPWLFVLPRDPAAETWTGARLGTVGATQLTGIPSRNRDELAGVLDSLSATGLPLFVDGDVSDADGDNGVLSADDQFVAALRAKHQNVRIQPVNALVAQLRGRKSPAELAMIRRAVEITTEAQREAMRAMPSAHNEYEIEALIEYTFRRNGAERPSFATIVGSGPNSTTLHYNADDRPIQPGEVVVMDIGASYAGYAADVTRTIPSNGTYSSEQRAVYQIVRDAQAAAERNARPGQSARAMNDSANAVIASGLTRLGLIESPTATFDYTQDGMTRELPQYVLYYMHGLGHGIGLEVHDPDQYYFAPGLIAEGSAFTIEPGIYVRDNLLETLPDTPRNRAMSAKIRAAVNRYRNIGVRIEDDYIVTDKGVEWISRAPREMSEIEALMRRPTP